MTLIISDTQSDLLYYRHMIDDDSFIFYFIYFYKAFDMIEHPCMLQTLEYVGLGENGVKVIGMLYDGNNSSVSLQHGTSKWFDVKRGIRQGCPSSPLLFILTAELLAILINVSLKNKSYCRAFPFTFENEICYKTSLEVLSSE